MKLYGKILSNQQNSGFKIILSLCPKYFAWTDVKMADFTRLSCFIAVLAYVWVASAMDHGINFLPSISKILYQKINTWWLLNNISIMLKIFTFEEHLQGCTLFATGSHYKLLSIMAWMLMVMTIQNHAKNLDIYKRHHYSSLSWIMRFLSTRI